MAIKALKLDDGTTIYVEVEETQQDLRALVSESGSSASNDYYLPRGAEQTSLIDDVVIGSKLLKETIAGAAKSARDSLGEMQPDEWSVELNIGFESDGKTLLSYIAKGSGSLKVTAKWKKV